MNSKVKAVFLDIGGVVLEIDWRRMLMALNIDNPAEQKAYVERFDAWPVHHEYERGHISSEQFLQEFVDFFSYAGSTEEVESAWQKLVVAEIPGISEVMDHFAELPFYTLSNTNALHFDVYVKQYAVFKKFDRLLTSFELGERKPDLPIYEKACATVGLKPHECLFIDDNAENIEAARRAGWQAELSVNSSERTQQIIESFV